jgi:myo-inositol-1-phosphate synthase
MQIKIDFLCRDSILAAPIVLDLALFLDLAQRCGMRGTQEWLSFYFKSPMTAPDLYPEHDIFIQLMKLKGVLRNFLSEDHITHMGLICGKALENGDAYQQCLLYFTMLLSNVLV